MFFLGYQPNTRVTQLYLLESQLKGPVFGEAVPFLPCWVSGTITVRAW